MWEPDPSWRALHGSGPSSAGLWLAGRDGESWVVKRLPRPEPGDALRLDARHAGYWRREADVALSPGLVDGPGIVAPAFGPVEEDAEGITLWVRQVEGPPPTALHTARSLGRFASRGVDTASWPARDLLGDRIRMAEGRGGWPTLERTALGDVADRLWRRRTHWLERARSGVHGRHHGDAVPGNFPGVEGGEVVAVDWQCFGVGPVGTDLGYFALSCREDFDVLLSAYVDGLTSEGFSGEAEEIRLVATVVAVYTVLGRTEWALAQAARGEGALAGKLRHPAVAVHVRALQRQYPQLERLL